jgi:hypothetical protein
MKSMTPHGITGLERVNKNLSGEEEILMHFVEQWDRENFKFLFYDHLKYFL